MIPDECHMPDLSYLQPLTPCLLASLMGFGDAGLSRNQGIYRRNFIRLVDKALVEYSDARHNLISQIEEKFRSADEMEKQGRIIFLFAFTNHIETSINAVRRLLLISDRLKNEPGPSIVSRQTKKLLNSLTKSIRDVRSCLEHIDERIHRGELPDDEPVVLSLNDTADAVKIGNDSLRLYDLATAVKKLHEIGERFIGLSPTEWPPKTGR